MKLTAKNIWLTSDTHYSHSNIVKGTTQWKDENGNVPLSQVRDFDTVEEMNDCMVENINSLVDSNDWLIHLGDWSFGGKDKIREFREKINCKNVILIYGNHDEHISNDSPNGTLKSLFSHSSQYEEIHITNDKKDKNLLVLFHYPIISWNHMSKGSYQIHGHMHHQGDDVFGNGRQMDVGICGTRDNGFRPYHLDEVVGLLKDRIRVHHSDHHTIK